MPKVGKIIVKLNVGEYVNIPKYYFDKVSSFAIPYLPEYEGLYEKYFGAKFTHAGKYYLRKNSVQELEEVTKLLVIELHAARKTKGRAIVYKIETETPRKTSYDWGDDSYELKFAWEIVDVFKLDERMFVDERNNKSYRLVDPGELIKKEIAFVEYSDEAAKFFSDFEDAMKTLIKKINVFVGTPKKVQAAIYNQFKLLGEGKNK